MNMLLPILKNADYLSTQQNMYFTESLSSNTKSPIVIYGTDKGIKIEYEAASDEEDYNTRLNSIKEEALANLRRIDVEYEIVDFEGSKIAFIQGHEYASEKIVDADFLQQIASELHSDMLLAGIPHKGLLILISFDSPLKFKLPSIIEKYYLDAPTYPICKYPLIIQNGVVVGMGADDSCNTTNDEDSFVFTEDMQSNYTINLEANTIDELTHQINDVFQSMLAHLLNKQKFGGKLNFTLTGDIPFDEVLQKKCDSYIKQFEENELLNIFLDTVLHQKLSIAFYHNEKFITQTKTPTKNTKTKSWWEFWK